MIARLKLKGIDGRAPPGVNNKALLLKVQTTSLAASDTLVRVYCEIIELRGTSAMSSTASTLKHVLSSRMHSQRTRKHLLVVDVQRLCDNRVLFGEL